MPLVASRVGGLPTLVGDAATLVPPGDASQLAAAIAAVLAAPDPQRVARGRRIAETHDWGHIGPRLLHTLRG